MKQTKPLRLLARIVEHGPILRSGVARPSRLSKPAVSAQVETLIWKRLVAAFKTPVLGDDDLNLAALAEVNYGLEGGKNEYADGSLFAHHCLDVAHYRCV